MTRSINHRTLAAMLASAAGLAVLGGGGASALAQTSELYLTNWDNGATFVVQNGAVVRQFNRSSNTDGPGLVVQSTIKCIGQDGLQSGREYDLNGAPLSGTYLNPRYTSLYDGATNGTNNWSVAHNDFGTNFAVVQGDADWQNLQVLFVPNRRSSGITYDANTNTLWISNNVGGSDRVQQYDLSGNVLFEFNVSLQSGGGYGIAWDPADDTLWLTGAFGTAGRIFQYSKTGTPLADRTIPGLASNILGAEFQYGGTARLNLRITGPCPGRVTVSWSNATPSRPMGIVFSSNTGNFVIPGGVCAGTQTGLSSAGIQLVYTGNTGPNGSGQVSSNAGTAACRKYLQMFVADGSPCAASNVVQIP